MEFAAPFLAVLVACFVVTVLIHFSIAAGLIAAALFIGVGIAWRLTHPD